MSERMGIRITDLKAAYDKAFNLSAEKGQFTKSKSEYMPGDAHLAGLQAVYELGRQEG